MWPYAATKAAVMSLTLGLAQMLITQDVLLLLDQVFAEPGWIPVFLGGLLYLIGLLVMSIAVWRSGTLSRWSAGLLAAAALVGLPSFLDVVALARVGAVLWIAAYIALAVDVWRNARAPDLAGSPAAPAE